MTPVPAAVGLGSQLRSLARPYRSRLVVVAAGVLATALIDLVGPLVVRQVIDHNLTPRSTAGLAAAAFVYIGSTAAGQILTAGYGYLAATVAQRALTDLRVRLFDHLLRLPASYHDRTPSGDAIARATTDVETIDDLFTSSIATLLGETVRLVTILAAMLVLSPRLTGLAVLSVPPLLIITSLLRRRIRDAERATRTAVADTTTALNDTLAGIDIVRAYARQATFTAQVRQVLGRWLAATNRSTAYNAVFAPSLAILSTAITAALLWYGGVAPTVGVSIGTLTAFVLLFARFFTPLINLGDEWQSIQAALAGAERIFGLLAQPAERHVPAPPRAAASAASTRTATFGYRPGLPVLHDISLTIDHGEYVAIAGRTGAGKSSILALLAGLYRPWTGDVELLGYNPYTLTDNQRRHLIGYVPQTPNLFTGTIADTLSFGDPSISRADLAYAADITGMHPVISTLPDSYDTIISSTAGTGWQPSAGQRQLLALTRALVPRPRILLLDEATAVVDPASDAAFRRALRDRVRTDGTTVVTVAHRLSTARDADRVLIIEDGRIVEAGAPAHLISAGGRFAAMTAIDDTQWNTTDNTDAPPPLTPGG